MASDFYDLRPEQVPNAVTQSFPNVHFLAKSSTVPYLQNPVTFPSIVVLLRISYEKMSAPCPGQLSAAQLGNILRAHQSVVLYGLRNTISATCADQLEATSK